MNPSLALWQEDELIQLFEFAGRYVSVTGISIDTRSLQEGDLFIALKGPQFDGHDFVTKAFENGASLAIVSAKDKLDEYLSDRLIIVSDTYQALLDLARFARSRSQAKIIGVTGSVGKTGAKNMLSVCLSHLEPQTSYIAEGNKNNEIGLPLMLARMPRHTKIGVFELGMNHAGEISALSTILKPDIALITTIEAVHLEFFNDVGEIADAKAEIFDGMQEGSYAVLNLDNPYFERVQRAALQKGVHVYAFSGTPEADGFYRECDLFEEKSHVHASINGQEVAYELSLPGKHLVLNSIAVLLALDLAGYQAARTAPCLAQVQQVSGRGVWHRVRWGNGEIILIDEAYNASPAAMKASIEHLGKVQALRKLVVIGDMLELGPKAQELHLSLKSSLLEAKIDGVFCCGPYMNVLFQALPEEMKKYATHVSKDLIEPLKRYIKEGDMVLIKGSLGSKMKIILDALLKQDEPA